LGAAPLSAAEKRWKGWNRYIREQANAIAFGGSDV
jgi:hypothetical protein